MLARSIPTTSTVPTRITPSRRRFMQGAAAGAAGLVIGAHLPSGRITSARAAAAGAAVDGVGPFEGYLRIAPDGTVTVISAHLDMGQGIWTGCASLAAEELDADWSRVRGEGGSGNPKLYGNIEWGGTIQGTGGSTGTTSSFMRYRQAGAMARAMLVEAAAKQWNVPAAEIAVANGVVTHTSGHSAGFGELAEAAASVPPPAAVTLKDRKDWKLIGNAKLPRLDSVEKTTGAPIFTIDVKLPGMLTAVVAHPPRFGATVRSFDATAAKRVKGVVDVVQIPRGVAVVADGFWAAKKGRDALTVEWDESGAEMRGSDALMAEYKALLDSPDAAIARSEGDAAGALAAAAKVVKADFEFPYLAHAALEPLDAVARMQDCKLEVWSGHQMPDLYQAVAAQVAEVDPANVKLHVTWAGGSFGRRAVADADIIAEAVATAKAIGWKAPVKVLWTREDDMTGGRYRPMYAHRLEAALDPDGNIVGWRHRVVGQSILAKTPFAEMMVKNGVDQTSVEGASNLPYAIPNLQVDLVTTDPGVPVLWWRSVGSTHTAYSSEVFIDELAQAAGKDPVEFRLAMLAGHPRHAVVLTRARDMAAAAGPAPAGRFRGIAVAESFGSYVAQVAEVSVAGEQVRVHNVWCAVDCGIAVNPDIVVAQIQGGIGFGLGAILKSQITLEEGVVQETNFDGYEVLTIGEMPHVEVAIIESDEKPMGVGEPGVPPIGPAVANAVAAATGQRIRVLPFSRNTLRSV